MRQRSASQRLPRSSDSDVLDESPARGGPPPGLALDPPEPAPEHPPEIPTERLDADALKVIYRLRHMGHQAYFVGGCVRDLLLGATPKDFDLATDAHPGEVRAIFRNCRLIGRRFRLAHVYFRGGKVLEVATFRKNPTDVAEDLPEDGDLLITRDNVFGTAEEDSVRRDFTVNGLFYDPSTGEVIDYVGGRSDLESHRIATIGDPEIRMREDPVRALRAVRFAARLGFTIAPDTFEAMRRYAGELARCAPPRLLEETFKILRCGNSARAFELLRASGALPILLPPLAVAMEGWGPERRRGFAAHLAALDRLVRSGAEVSEAVLLGALLMHLGARAEDGTRPEADALLASLVQSARLPRKVSERVRLALHAQRGFLDTKKRRRRGRGASAQAYQLDAIQLLRISVEATGEGGDALSRLERPDDLRPPARHRDGPVGSAEREARAEVEVAAILEGPDDRDEDAHVIEVRGTTVEDSDEEGVPVTEVRGTTIAGALADDSAESRRRRRRRGGRRRRRRGATGGAGAPPSAAGDPS
jgi:poly(A) polymerase